MCIRDRPCGAAARALFAASTSPAHHHFYINHDRHEQRPSTSTLLWDLRHRPSQRAPGAASARAHRAQRQPQCASMLIFPRIFYCVRQLGANSGPIDKGR
eukprot:12360281-Alexandrium_andersonii.AAC.1